MTTITTITTRDTRNIGRQQIGERSDANQRHQSKTPIKDANQRHQSSSTFITNTIFVSSMYRTTTLSTCMAFYFHFSFSLTRNTKVRSDIRIY